MGAVTMVVVMVMVTIMLSMTIIPSSAEDNNPTGSPMCWVKIGNCIEKVGIDVGDPLVNFGLCCPVIKPQVANTTCFCSIKDHLKDIPTEQPTVVASEVEVFANKLLSDCKLTSTFDQLCNGVSESESATSESAKEAGKTPGLGKSGATKIGSLIGTFSAGALFIWMVILS